MKIAYVSAAAIPSRTANSIHVLKMAQALRDEGHEVLLLAPGAKSGVDPDPDSIFRHYGLKGGFTLYRYRAFRGSLRTALNTVSILRILLRQRPDLVYGRYSPACAVSGVLGFPVGYEAHGPFWREGKTAAFFMFLLRKSRGFRKLVVISEALKRMYLEKSAFGEESILVAHDGADALDDVSPRVNPSPLRAGYFGHLYKGRGIEIILEVAARLPDIEFHVFGGTDKDIAYWKERTRPNVFFQGFVDPGQVAARRSECDILLAPYQTEVAISGGQGNTSAYMSPLKIFEYMSQNRAVIASDLPVLGEVLRQEENALLVAPASVDQWTSAVERLRDPILRERLANRAHEEFLEHYTWRRRARNIVESLSGGRSRKSR